MRRTACWTVGLKMTLQKSLGIHHKRIDKLLCVGTSIMAPLVLVDSTFTVSATWPESVRRLASTFQKHPVRVTVGSAELTANGRVEQCRWSFAYTPPVNLRRAIYKPSKFLTTPGQKSNYISRFFFLKCAYCFLALGS